MISKKVLDDLNRKMIKKHLDETINWNLKSKSVRPLMYAQTTVAQVLISSEITVWQLLIELLKGVTEDYYDSAHGGLKIKWLQVGKHVTNIKRLVEFFTKLIKLLKK